MEQSSNGIWLCVVGLVASTLFISCDAANITSMAEILENLKTPKGPKPVLVRMPNPPRLEGPLKPNNLLTKAQAYAFNQITGPESMVVINRIIYTGTKDGWVLLIKPNGSVRRILRMSIRTCGRPDATEDSCGRPMGIRADPTKHYLIVADAYNGIFKIYPRTRKYERLVDARRLRVNGKPLGYINDLAVARDLTIFFTSSSTKWKPSQLLNIIFEGETTGRVLMYKNDPRYRKENRVVEVVTNLHYPNGLELGPGQKYLLVAEGGRSRIFRTWLGETPKGHRTIEVFANNLPGFVDNIRMSPRGTFWVGLSRARHAGLPSVLDTYGNKPEIRANLMNLVSNNMIFDEPNFGIVVELDQNGAILRSLQDPTGKVYTSVSEVDEEKGILFIASKGKKYIGVMAVPPLPSAKDPQPPSGPIIPSRPLNPSQATGEMPQGNGGNSGTGTGSGTGSGTGTGTGTGAGTGTGTGTGTGSGTGTGTNTGTDPGSTGSSTGSGPPPSGSHVIDIQALEDPELRAMMSKVQIKMRGLTMAQIQTVVLLLTKRLYETSEEAKKAKQEVATLRQTLELLQEGIVNSGGGSGGFVRETTPAPSSGGSGGGGGGGGGDTTPSSGGGGSGSGSGGWADNLQPTTQSPAASGSPTDSGGNLVHPDQSGTGSLSGSPDGGVSGGAPDGGATGGGGESTTQPPSSTESSTADSTTQGSESTTTSSPESTTTTSAGGTTS